MDFKANKYRKCCATCANWSGPRTVNSVGSEVSVPYQGGHVPNAKCFLHPLKGGFSYGPPADWCCGDYTKWAGLK